jgi:hypothetical protein
MWGKNWLFISQKTKFFIVTAMETSNITKYFAVLKVIALLSTSGQAHQLIRDVTVGAMYRLLCKI